MVQQSISLGRRPHIVVSGHFLVVMLLHKAIFIRIPSELQILEENALN